MGCDEWANNVRMDSKLFSLTAFFNAALKGLRLGESVLVRAQCFVSIIPSMIAWMAVFWDFYSIGFGAKSNLRRSHFGGAKGGLFVYIHGTWTTG
jgi:hypothetical protein